MRAQLLDGASGEWWLAVETSWDRACCPACGVGAVGHGRRRVVVRDLSLADQPVVLVWAKRLWRCPEPARVVCTWSEGRDQIASRAVLTEWARAEIARRVGPAEHSVACAARDFGVSWHTAMAAVRDHGRPRIDHLARLGAPPGGRLAHLSELGGRSRPSSGCRILARSMTPAAAAERTARELLGRVRCPSTADTSRLELRRRPESSGSHLAIQPID